MYASIARPFRHVLPLLLGSMLVGAALVRPGASAQPGAEYIVQATTAEAASRAVIDAGGAVMRRLEIIDGVSAALPAAALARLRASAGVRLHANGAVRVADDTPAADTRGETTTSGFTLYPSAATGAAALQQRAVSTRVAPCTGQQAAPTGAVVQKPLLGYGVTVAVIDSGLLRMRNRQGANSGWDSYDAPTRTLYVEGDSASGISRCIVYRDFLPQSADNANIGPQDSRNSADQYGHGTHVISSIADNRVALLGPNLSGPVGVAPKVNLVIARALDKDGGGKYDDLIAAVQWVLENKDRYNIRVLNLSIGSNPVAPADFDPMTRVVEYAWLNGITVVCEAGNEGEFGAGGILSPGTSPYVITVGATDT